MLFFAFLLPTAMLLGGLSEHSIPVLASVTLAQLLTHNLDWNTISAVGITRSSVESRFTKTKALMYHVLYKLLHVPD